VGTANFVIPHPPGFLIRVPGQVITEEIQGNHGAQGAEVAQAGRARDAEDEWRTAMSGVVLQQS
jgi:hypothetical protein